MQHITRIVASNFQDLSFDEEIPRLLLLTGPNGSGKTARMRAIALAVAGVGKDGLAPFTTQDDCYVGVETSEGLKVVRRTKIQRDPLKVSNVAKIEPSQGEKTTEAVTARLERDLRPNLLALRLDAFFDASGRERRRALLAAVNAGAERGGAAVMQELDTHFAGEPEPVRKAWARVRAAVRALPDALETLQALEGAAKAHATDYRARKAAATAALGTGTAAAVKSVAQAKADLEAADREVRDHSAAMAAGRRGAADRARLVKEQAEQIALLPENVRGLPATEAAKATDDGWRAADREVGRTKAVLDAAKEALVPVRAKAEAAKTTATKWEGRIHALEDLLKSCSEDAAACPVCGTEEGFSVDAFRAKIAKDRHSLTSLTGRWKEQHAALVAAEKARDDAENAALQATIDARKAERAAQAAKRLLEIESALVASEAQATAAFDEGAMAAAEARQRDAQAALQAASKAEGDRAARQRAEAEATEADALRAAAEKIQEVVGPLGKQGEMLDAPLATLTTAMNEAWQRPGKLSWKMQDLRGDPDADLMLERAGAKIPLRELSAGERATALAALIAGLAQMQTDRTTIALVEAGEIDETSLFEMLGALGGIDEIANVVVATHLMVTAASRAGIQDNTGFETRVLALPDRR